MTQPAHCFECGGALASRYVEDEERDRLVCAVCGHIHYVNPHLVAGTVPVSEGRVWLLRRAIEPRYGFWTFPAGFMELKESAEEAAARETREELGMDVRVTRLLGVFSRASWSNVLLVYEAIPLSQPTGGRETLEYRLFAPEEIPWSDLAFPSTREALQAWVKQYRSQTQE